MESTAVFRINHAHLGSLVHARALVHHPAHRGQADARLQGNGFELMGACHALAWCRKPIPSEVFMRCFGSPWQHCRSYTSAIAIDAHHKGISMQATPAQPTNAAPTGWLSTQVCQVPDLDRLVQTRTLPQHCPQASRIAHNVPVYDGVALRAAQATSPRPAQWRATLMAEGAKVWSQGCRCAGGAGTVPGPDRGGCHHPAVLGPNCRVPRGRAGW